MEKTRQCLGERRQYIVTHLVRCQRLSYSSESRSIFSFSSLSGTLPLLQGWVAYGSPLAQYLLAPTHAENWHGLLKDPALYFVARGKLWCNVRCLSGPDPSPRCSAREVRRVCPPSCSMHLTRWSLSSSVGLLWRGWELTRIQKNISSFLAAPVVSWTRFLRLSGCTSAHGSAKVDVEDAWQRGGRQDLLLTAAPHFLQLKAVPVQQPHSPQRPPWGRGLNQWERYKVWDCITLQL